MKGSALGGTNEKQPPNLLENSLSGDFSKKEKQQKEQKTKPPPKKTPSCVLANTPPIFGKCLFLQLTLFYFCKAVFCRKDSKIVLKTPFETPSQNGTFETESAILAGFSLCPLKPLFL